ncbi:VOC family protein [Bacillus sp. ISL-35]|uniref:VOC family protein n=1 Tax=Bacillus sp. ISL-35 TaxID=2819122 RepID=UPI001BEC975D|nr:VOC family protein [Bacillus sp. ISL-35]MBT2680135.1 VOC family protein [Bacillus sp. ISL-35]MBT2704409.1 VOC family protein [Chryseobacterium sp. ISL-80]
MVTGIVPYIVTNGNGQEAVNFYKEALGAEVISLQTFGDMPANPDHPLPEEAKNRVLNAQLKIGDAGFMLSDTFPGHPYQLGSQVTIALMVDNAAEAKEVFNKLQVDGKVTMPLQETFWSPAYGQLTDKFGVEWQVSTESNK